jgi:hypothetical protein
MYTNRLLQARQAAGQAFQQSIGPDGTPNQNLLMQNLAANPNAAMAAQESAQAGQNLASTNLGFNTAQQTIMAQNIGSMLTMPPDQQTRQNYEGLVGYLHKAAGLDDSHVASALQAMPPDGSPPQAFQQFAKRLLVGSLAGPQVAGAAFGNQIQNDNGQSVQGGVQGSPMGANPGAISLNGPSIPKYISPEAGATRVQIGITPDGKPIYAPLASVTPPGMGGAFSGDTSFANGGRLPPQLRGPNAVPNGGAVVTGLGPAQTAAQSTKGTQSAAAFQGIADQGVQAQSQTAILSNMLGDTSQFTTGPGQDWIKTKEAIIQRFAPGIAKSFGVTPDSLAANESFDKFANQLANAQGAGSDARMAVNQGANPSSHLTPAGADSIIRQLIGNSDYLAARAKLAASYPDQTDRPGFEASIASNLDPRVFQYSRMTPEQKGTFLTSMKSGKAAFKKAYGWASQNGLLSDPNAGQ